MSTCNRKLCIDQITNESDSRRASLRMNLVCSVDAMPDREMTKLLSFVDENFDFHHLLVTSVLTVCAN